MQVLTLTLSLKRVMSLLRLSSLLLCFSLAFAKEIKLYAIVEGQVKKVYVKEGDKVKAGDVLVEIDPILYITRRESLSAELESQKLNLDCTLRAPTNGVIRKVLIKEGSFVNGTMIPQTVLIMEER